MSNDGSTTRLITASDLWTERQERLHAAPLLVRVREQYCLGLREVAQHLGIAHSHLLAIERGHVPRPALCRRIAEFYGLPIEVCFPRPEQDEQGNVAPTTAGQS